MAKRRLEALSRAETEILRIVWQLETATVRQVVDNLPTERQITYATVQTLLRRLEKKGYVSHRNQGKAHVFFEAVKRQDVIKKAVSEFVGCLFGGEAMPLVQHLAEHGQIDGDDIRQLKRIISNKRQ